MREIVHSCLMVSRRTGGVEDKYRIEQLLKNTACLRGQFASYGTPFLYTYVSTCKLDLSAPGTCVFKTGNGGKKMANNYRDDGFVWFEDQISELADLLITVQGIRFIYLKKHDRSWIARIGDEGMRFALLDMPEKQLRMIEKMVFEDKTVTDIHREMNLTITEIRMELRDMRKALLAAM